MVDFRQATTAGPGSEALVSRLTPECVPFGTEMGILLLASWSALHKVSNAAVVWQPQAPTMTRGTVFLQRLTSTFAVDRQSISAGEH